MPPDEDPTTLGCGHDFRDEIERRVLSQDRLLEVAKGPSGIEAEVFAKPSAAVLIGPERFRLAAGSVEREHELGSEPLAERMLGHERLELADELGVAAQLEVGVDPCLQRREPCFLEPADLGLRKRRVGEVRQRRSSPERQRLAELRRRPRRVRAAGFVDESVEPLEIELPVARDEQVSGRARLDHAVPEELAQLRDVDLDAAQAACGRVVRPDLVEQAIGGHDGVRAQEKCREERPLPRPAERERAAVVDHLQRPKDAEFHLARGGTYRL